MSKKPPIVPFSAEQQKEYERSARLQYGPDKVNESIRRWNGYTPAQRDAIMAEGGQVYTDLAAALEAGEAPESDTVQAILVRWHNHIYNFYEPTLDILRGLGELYNTSPEFMAFFEQIHPELPPYLQAGIAQYVDDLETAAIERLLAEDEVKAGR
jgi:hypothetical protein